jgi:hypothetical protein
VFFNTFSAFKQKHGTSFSQSSVAIGTKHSSVYCHPCNGVVTLPSKFCNGLSGGYKHVTRHCHEGATFFFGGGGGAVEWREAGY